MSPHSHNGHFHFSRPSQHQILKILSSLLRAENLVDHKTWPIFWWHQGINRERLKLAHMRREYWIFIRETDCLCLILTWYPVRGPGTNIYIIWQSFGSQLYRGERRSEPDNCVLMRPRGSVDLLLASNLPSAVAAVVRSNIVIQDDICDSVPLEMEQYL